MPLYPMLITKETAFWVGKGKEKVGKSESQESLKLKKYCGEESREVSKVGKVRK